MKNFCNVFVFILLQVSTWGQVLEIEYHIHSKQDRTTFIRNNKETLKKVPPQMLSKVYKMIDKNSATIHVLKQHIYTKEKISRMVYDSTFLDTTIFQQQDDLNYNAVTTSWVEYQKNHGSKRIVLKSEIMDEVIEVPFPDFKWKIFSDSTKNILGYPCIMAVGMDVIEGKPVTVFFTLSIPVSDGPYYYGGLPGLILEVHEDTKKFVITCLNESNLTPNYDILTANSDMKLEEYLNKNKNLMSNMASVGSKRNK